MADKKQTMLYGLLTSIASKITYDNTESGLTADNVQDAIDEINDNLVDEIEELTAPSNVTITLTNGSFNSNRLVRMGKIVLGTINTAGCSTTGEFVTVGTLDNPKDFPKEQARGISCNPNYTISNWFNITSNGELQIRFATSANPNNNEWFFAYFTN